MYPLHTEAVRGCSRRSLQNKRTRTRPFNDTGDVEHIIFVRHDANTLRWARPEFIELLHKPTEYGWRDGLFGNEECVSVS